MLISNPTGKNLFMSITKLTQEFILQKKKGSFNISYDDQSAALGELLMHTQKSIVLFSDLANSIYGTKTTQKTLDWIITNRNIQINLFSPDIPSFNSFFVSILKNGHSIQPNIYKTHPKLKNKPLFCIIDNEFAFVQTKDGAKIIYNPKECQKLLSGFQNLNKNMSICHKKTPTTLFYQSRDYTN